MNRRVLLWATFGATTAIGLALSAIPLMQSMSVTAAQENAAWAACDVSELMAGQTKVCGYAMVYRRTEEDKSSVAKYVHLLADPESKHSEQPEVALNQWRSEREDFFVFRPWAPVRHCGVELHKDFVYLWDVPETEAVKDLPYFTEPCEGRAWDTSGRLYHREGFPPEKNLIVPNVKWVSESKVLIYGL